MIVQTFLSAISAALYGIIFLTPLIYSSGGIFDNEFIRIVFLYFSVGIICILLALFSLAGNKVPLLPKRIQTLVLFYLIVYLGASVFGISPKDSIAGRYGVWIYSFLSQIVYVSLLYVVFFLTITTKNRIKSMFFISIFAAAIIVSLHGIIGIFGAGDINFTDLPRIYSTFKNPNHLGFYLTLVAVISFWSAVEKKTVRFWGILTLFLTLIALILTQSRGSWLSFALSMITTMIIFRSRLKLKVRRNQILILLSGVILLLIFFLPVVKSRLLGVFNGATGRVSYKIRLSEWHTVLKIWQSYPLTGIGPENMDLVYPALRDRSQNMIEDEWKWRTLTARNLWLELLATTGPLGLVSFLTIGIIVWFYLKKDKETVPLLALIIGFYIHSFFYAPNIAVMTVFFITLGLAISQTEKPKTVRYIIIPKGLSAGIGIIAAALIYFTLKFTVSEYFGVKALEYIANDTEQVGISKDYAQKAYNIYPFLDKNLRLLILTQEEYIRVTDQHKKGKKAIEGLKKNLNRLEGKNMSDVENLKTLTSGFMRYAAFTNTPYEKAILYGRKLTKLDPTSPGSWDTLGIVYLEAQHFEDAQKVFNHIIYNLKPDYPYAYFHIGETYRRMGETQRSIPFYQKAVELGYEGGLREIEEVKHSSGLLPRVPQSAQP